MKHAFASLLAACLSLSLAPPSAQAHHASGAGGPSASSRLSAQRASANTQVDFAFSEGAQQNGEETVPISALTVGTEYAFSESLAAGAALPLQRFRPRDSVAPAGIGAATVFAKWLPDVSPDKPWLLLTEVGLPTQTVVLGTDPGPVGTAALSLGYAFRRGRWFLQPLFGLGGDGRRAGAALDVLASAHAAFALNPLWSLTLGAAGQMRALTLCRSPQGFELCGEGRVSEPRTPSPSLMATAEAGAEALLWRSGGVRLAMQLPLTERRLIAWRAQLSTVFLF